MVGKLHGMPRSITFDRDPLFVSKFWQSLFSLSGTKLRMSSAYHPQMDGQTEVANRIIEQYLRAFMHRRPSVWGHFLLWAEWPYNTSTHSATELTPLEITFGRKPPSFPQYLTGTSTVATMDELLSQREAMFTLLRRKLQKAQARMKEIADGHRRDHEFQVNEWVLVKLRPYQQTTVSGTGQSKLSRHFYGPFRIIVRMGPIAYKLELPEHSRIHPVFHCSLLKPFMGSPNTVEVEKLPSGAMDNQPVSTPLAILGHKTIPTNHGPKQMVLVQWQGLHPDKTSWEDWASLQELHHLEDKVLFEEQGNVTRSNPELQITRPNDNNNQRLAVGRPKRGNNTPSYLKDYVLKI